MRSLFAVLRILLAALVVAAAMPGPTTAVAQVAAVSQAKADGSENGAACAGHTAAHSCCQSGCLGCAPLPTVGLVSANTCDGRHVPVAEIEPPSRATGGIERPPRTT